MDHSGTESDSTIKRDGCKFPSYINRLLKTCTSSSVLFVFTLLAYEEMFNV